MKVVNEILFLTSYPPRECGIATYSQDLINFIKEKFGKTFSVKVVALESNNFSYSYGEDVKAVFHTTEISGYLQLAEQINRDDKIKLVFIQHEFGLFGGESGEYLIYFLKFLKKKVLFTFHTVLPNPNEHFKTLVNDIAEAASGIIVMTKSSANILIKDYGIEPALISIIPHGTHLVGINDSEKLKSTFSLRNKFVLTTFGLLSSGKSIETALDALPSIIKEFPNVIYFILGKTHPAILKNEGEKYRNFLKQKALILNITDHVKFVDSYLSLDELLEYLQLTDIYLFTSKDPNQAVSGTFSYAMGCGCPVVSTPIPQAVEMLTTNAGMIVDFGNHQQMADAVNKLLRDKALRKQMSLNACHIIRPSCWQNSAISHGILFKKIINDTRLRLIFQIPSY
jgi:glycosyltransferase involved in cell wall biosynthesis